MSKRMYFCLLRQLTIAILVLGMGSGFLWGLDPELPVQGYLLDQWQSGDGIPSNLVISIAQTPDGYLWFGTSRGLVRFDGMRYVPVRFAESEEVYRQEVRSLFVDVQGTLWIGTSMDLTAFNPTTNQYKRFTAKDGISEDGIRRITSDFRGNIWISFTSSYVNRFSNGKFSAFNDSLGLLGKKINAIVEDKQGHLLLGSREQGIFIYREGRFEPVDVALPKNANIIDMFEDSHGSLWLGTSLGLLLLRPGAHSYRFDVTPVQLNDRFNHHITSIKEDRDGNLWVGSLKGLWRITRSGEKGFTSDIVLESVSINALFEDHEHSLWLATNSGVQRLKDSKFTPYYPMETQDGESPLALFQDRKGDILIGTLSGKLFRCGKDNQCEQLHFDSQNETGIAAMAEDRQGNLWLGTIGKGVYRLKDSHFTRFTTDNGLSDNLVTSIYRDSKNRLWISTFDGVSVIDADGNITSLKNKDGLSGKMVHNVMEDREKNIWLAADKGLTVIKKGDIERMEMERFLVGVSVTCIHEDRDSKGAGDPVFWIATGGDGLKRLNLKSRDIRSFTRAQGMLSNFLYYFVEDSQGRFWLLSKNGILRVDKNQLNLAARDTSRQLNCVSFGVADGLKSEEFINQFSDNSILKAQDGNIWFITVKGISIVNPEKIGVDKIPPPVVIESVSFDNRPTPLPAPSSGEVVFKGLKDLSIFFTAPTFLSPEKISFKYRLQGDDDNWQYILPGQERAAHFHGLSPGTYSFTVTVCNAEGVWNPKGETFTFKMDAFFYQTLWFRVAIFILLAGVAIFLFFWFKRISQELGKRGKYKSTVPLNPVFAQECVTRIQYLMEIEKVYKDENISLQSLADKLSIPAHQLSQLLNDVMKQNFADLINSHRIEEAKGILNSPRGARLKISSIAMEVGFNTMAAFYKAFKKYTGSTPSEFKKYYK